MLLASELYKSGHRLLEDSLEMSTQPGDKEGMTFSVIILEDSTTLAKPMAVCSAYGLPP